MIGPNDEFEGNCPMPRRPSGRQPRRKARRRRARPSLTALWRSKRLRGALRSLRRAPRSVQIAGCAAVACSLWLGVNWGYQVFHKPSELFFPVSGRLYKTPSQTWNAYAPLFRRHSTSLMSPELLAAIAQVEASGNPVARTYWRWALTLNPLNVYRPASSAVGMYQITDGTFEQARRYCIHDHRVVTDGAWHELRACWFNGLYTRTVPSHAIELTSAYLDRRVAQVLEHLAIEQATLEQRQSLAAAIHLCGAGGGTRYARRGFDARGQRCGAHDLARYLAKVDEMKQVFSSLAAGNGAG